MISGRAVRCCAIADIAVINKIAIEKIATFICESPRIAY
jgi:hypothetical protein